jgi:hypothetical protein
MKTNIFDAEEMLEYAETERAKERAKIMLMSMELARELDSLIINNFVLELAERVNKNDWPALHMDKFNGAKKW